MTEQRPLPHPLRRALVDEPDPRRLARIWRRVADGRSARPGAAWLRPASAFAFIAAAAFYFKSRAVEVEPVVPPQPVAPVVAEAPVERPAPKKLVTFGKSGRALVSEQTTLSILSDEPERMALLLEHGKIELDLEGTPQRSWSLDCGLAQIELFGARVDIDRSDRRLVVALERGAAELRSPSIPGGVKRIQAPDSITIEAPVDPGPAPKRVVPVAPSALEPGTPAPLAVPEPSLTADALVALADQAQARRDFSGAVEHLGRLVAEHPSDPRSALGSFNKGRLELDQLGRPADAARSFERAFELGLPAALEEDGLARLCDAYRQAGDRSAAAEVEARYRRRFPEGRRLEAEGPGAPRR